MGFYDATSPFPSPPPLYGEWWCTMFRIQKAEHLVSYLHLGRSTSDAFNLFLFRDIAIRSRRPFTADLQESGPEETALCECCGLTPCKVVGPCDSIKRSCGPTWPFDTVQT